MKKMRNLLAVTFLAFVLFSLPVASGINQPVIEVEAKTRNGLVKKGSTYYYYKRGKKVKKQWVKVKKKSYYFKKDGKAATGSYKIKSKYYIFKANGQLYKPSKKKIVTVKGQKYQVSPKGTAVSGWTSGKQRYFKKNGAMATGIQSIRNTFYAFDASGKQNVTLSKKLQGASNYEQDMTALYALIGKPVSASYAPGCYGGSGKDGTLVYPNFIVSTFRYDDGREIFMDVNAR
ncbi:MAG: hypothetical protein SPF99_01045 [Anaerobutyricum sp.]|nr:hypothetical protein [Anaerobutyricum sp.]